jgi:hypothetical protein
VLGASGVAAPLQASLHGNIHLWDPSLLPRVNLTRVIGIDDFPTPRAAADGADDDLAVSLECAICYT